MIRRRLIVAILGAFALIVAPAQEAHGDGKVAWLDEVVQQVLAESRVVARGAADPGASAAARGTVKLFANEAETALATLARRHDDLARAGARFEEPTEALLNARFAKLVRSEPEAARAFKSLAPAEKRVVVEMGETARRLALKHGDQAEGIIKKLGTEGMSAVRVYGDDVAETIAKEGPEAVNVLRKTGRSGWAFFTGTVLPHKKKLAAAGVLALFLANPEKFLDTAGNVTEYAVAQFAKAGIALAGAVGSGAGRGLEQAFGQALGLGSGAVRALGVALALLLILGAVMLFFGIPMRSMLRPLTRLWHRRKAPAKELMSTGARPSA